ncbi:MAG: hypothetical protein K0R18_380 [Bacillales bacterium]|nr:hypothetical protein [Bacillales bacterium]
MENEIIQSVEFEPTFKWAGNVAQYAVHAITASGKEKLFSFYTDEKSYHHNQSQFVGMTVGQAREKFFKDDVAYLRS